MFKRYGADQFAPGGFYLNRKTWEFVQIDPDGGYLKGSDGVSYSKVPVLLVLVLGPLAGLAFILFLPFAVPFVALNALGRPVIRRLIEMSRRVTGIIRRRRHPELRVAR